VDVRHERPVVEEADEEEQDPGQPPDGKPGQPASSSSLRTAGRHAATLRGRGPEPS
jgi:hypothetical protein